MAKEWILNMATNRWGLNKKNRVGPVSEWIRECSPRTRDEWKQFYYQKLSQFLTEKGIHLTPEEYIEDLGKKLCVKITEVIQKEIDEVTEEECVEYIRRLVIDRTFEGYKTEINTIYGRLQEELGVVIKPAPDQWDRLYNVDFYIEVGGRYIGLQIKPVTYEQTPEIYRWKGWMAKSHRKFEKKFGGKVFIVFSVKKGRAKEIYNSEVVDEIKREIERLKNLAK